MRKVLVAYLVFTMIILVPVASSIFAQEASDKNVDEGVKHVEGLIRDAWREMEKFEAAGGKAQDEAHPGRKWAAVLWQYREQNPGGPAAARATAEALHLLVHSDRVDEAIARADSLSATDAAWKDLIRVLKEAAGIKSDYDFLIRKAQWLLEQATERDVKMVAQFGLADAYWKKGDAEKAKRSFQLVIDKYPDTPLAKDAEGNIHEIESLNVGQPAPLFAHRSTTGVPVSLFQFRGKVVLLNFWASW